MQCLERMCRTKYDAIHADRMFFFKEQSCFYLLFQILLFRPTEKAQQINFRIFTSAWLDLGLSLVLANSWLVWFTVLSRPPIVNWLRVGASRWNWFRTIIITVKKTRQEFSVMTFTTVWCAASKLISNIFSGIHREDDAHNQWSQEWPALVKTEKVMSEKESLELGFELRQPDISHTGRQIEQ